MSLADLVTNARVPPITTGRLTAAERESSIDAIVSSVSDIKAGTSRVQFFDRMLTALIAQAGGLVDSALAARAANAARKAAEAEIARAQMEAEGEEG